MDRQLRTADEWATWWLTPPPLCQDGIERAQRWAEENPVEGLTPRDVIPLLKVRSGLRGAGSTESIVLTSGWPGYRTQQRRLRRLGLVYEGSTRARGFQREWRAELNTKGRMLLFGLWDAYYDGVEIR